MEEKYSTHEPQLEHKKKLNYLDEYSFRVGLDIINRLKSNLLITNSQYELVKTRLKEKYNPFLGELL